jgi:hypothetical protein
VNDEPRAARACGDVRATRALDVVKSVRRSSDNERPYPVLCDRGDLRVSSSADGLWTSYAPRGAPGCRLACGQNVPSEADRRTSSIPRREPPRAGPDPFPSAARRTEHPAAAIDTMATSFPVVPDERRSPPPGLMVKLREGAALSSRNVPDYGTAFLRRSARSGSPAPHVLIEQVRVDLSGRNVGMAKEPLGESQVARLPVHLAGVGMSRPMPPFIGE